MRQRERVRERDGYGWKEGGRTCERQWGGEGDRQHCSTVNSLSLSHLTRTHKHTHTQTESQTHQNRHSMQRECHFNEKCQARQQTPDTAETDTP